MRSCFGRVCLFVFRQKELVLKVETHTKETAALKYNVNSRISNIPFGVLNFGLASVIIRIYFRLYGTVINILKLRQDWVLVDSTYEFLANQRKTDQYSVI